MCEDGPSAAIATLQQVLAEGASSADAYAQPGGNGAVVPAAWPNQCAERKENKGSETGESNSGIRQPGLLILQL